MRNIISCNLTKKPIEIGVTNAQCVTNCLSVNFIVSEEVKQASFYEDIYIKLVLQDSSEQKFAYTKLLNNEVELEIPFDTYKGAGTIAVNLYSSTFTSDTLFLVMTEELTSNMDIVAKKSFEISNTINVSKFGGESSGEIVLYENEEGSNETIELSDDAANYLYMDIYFKDQNSIPNHGFVRVYKPNGKYTFLHVISLAASGGGHYLKTRTVEIKDNQIVTVGTRYGQAYLKASTSPTVAQENYIYITRVVGYK